MKTNFYCIVTRDDSMLLVFYNIDSCSQVTYVRYIHVTLYVKMQLEGRSTVLVVHVITNTGLQREKREKSIKSGSF